MEYICENQQHFVWGTRLRLKDSEGKVKTVDVTNKMKEDGFTMADEGYVCNEDGSFRELLIGEEHTDNPSGGDSAVDPPTPGEPPASER